MKENSTSKARLVPLFLMGWEALIPNVICEHIFYQGPKYLLWA
jgi:hypothetical protein